MNKERAYQILLVSQISTFPEIKASFRELSKKYHPDINKDNNASVVFRNILEAYKFLLQNHKEQIKADYVVYILGNKYQNTSQYIPMDILKNGGNVKVCWMAETTEYTITIPIKPSDHEKRSYLIQDFKLTLVGI